MVPSPGTYVRESDAIALLFYNLRLHYSAKETNSTVTSIAIDLPLGNQGPDIELIWMQCTLHSWLVSCQPRHLKEYL